VSYRILETKLPRSDYNDEENYNTDIKLELDVEEMAGNDVAVTFHYDNEDNRHVILIRGKQLDDFITALEYYRTVLNSGR